MTDSTTLTLDAAAERFLHAARGRNRSAATLIAYGTDIRQFIAWLQETNAVIQTVADVEPLDVTEYLGHLAERGLSGVSRARKLAALREFYRYLVSVGIVEASPVERVATPKREQRGRNYLSPEEYNRLLAAAGGHPRDFCILTLFLQTGIRVSELCALVVDDIDLAGRLLHVRDGKGMKARSIELEKKGVQAVRSYLAVRPDGFSETLFLNYKGEPLSERSVQKLLDKYVAAAGITKNISPHSLRHTFASYKARRGVSAYQLKEWLGHAKLDTTSIYVHLAKQDAKKVMEATSL